VIPTNSPRHSVARARPWGSPVSAAKCRQNPPCTTIVRRPGSSAAVQPNPLHIAETQTIPPAFHRRRRAFIGEPQARPEWAEVSGLTITACDFGVRVRTNLVVPPHRKFRRGQTADLFWPVRLAK